MGKKNKTTPNLGRSLIKDRFGPTKGRKMVENDSMLHTTEIQDGYDWGRLNLQSVTEESSFQEFLSTAELAGTEFQGEKLNITFVNPIKSGLLSTDEKSKMKVDREKFKDFLSIPRRPKWDSSTTAEQLSKMERESFLDWRRRLSEFQDKENVLLTPFEKNIEYWRQLWRVIERSDVVAQIVDARNPLLFRCEDLEKYVHELSPDKINLILINKADFLTIKQREYWVAYFTDRHVKVAFFSAQNALELFRKVEESKREPPMSTSVIPYSIDRIREDVRNLDNAVNESADRLYVLQNNIDSALDRYANHERRSTDFVSNSCEILTRDRLIHLFKTVHKGTKITTGVTTVGLVGYPNVGKSSTVNTLLTSKKASVSATPGKTKHFQTFYLDDDLLLCDSPGLVMPSFVSTKAEMVLNGILPIDQLRDHVPAINMIAHSIPRHIFEDKYGIMLPVPDDSVDKHKAPTAEELLNSLGFNRGFMTANGQPDNSRSARAILKDFFNGKLLYCNAPPEIAQETYHTFPSKSRADRPLPPREWRAIKLNKISTADLDKTFFKTDSKGVHAKGVTGKAAGLPSANTPGVSIEKPWKKENKHANKNKKEKTRRLYSHLDEH